MAPGIVTASYIIAAVLFILSLGGLSHPETARRGNAYGMAGMVIAIAATILGSQLPVLDGYEATRRIKATPAIQGTPVIAVTSYALSGDEAKAHEAGCDDYVTKPFSPRLLLAKVREFLD